MPIKIEQESSFIAPLFYRQLLENQIQTIERGAFRDLVSMERL